MEEKNGEYGEYRSLRLEMKILGLKIEIGHCRLRNGERRLRNGYCRLIKLGLKAWKQLL